MVADYRPGNRLTLLESGAEYFPALLTAIDSAQREIFLESYIFADDPIGQRVAAALCQAAARGVSVRLTVDGFGARNFAQDFLSRFQAAGVHALLYRAERGWLRLRRHRLRRLHRKLVVIDARIAFIGGINIVDDHNAPPDMAPRFDYAVRIEGPLLADLHASARRLWESISWATWRRRLPPPRPAADCCPQRGEQSAALLVRDNLRHRQDILNAYISAIEQAKESILIANAYVLPGVRFGRALQAAARRGVHIRILLQGKSDHPLLQQATRTLYRAALTSGIRIFEYEKSFLHAKVAVIDGHWATVGSSNIDPFSLLLAREANIAVDDRRFAGELTRSLEAALADGGRELLLDDLAAQSWSERFLCWLSYGLVRLLVGLTGYGPRHWQADEEQTG